MVSESKKDKTLADRYQAAQPQAEDKLYMVNDRDGLYVTVTPAGSISFRYNYSINDRQETITFDRYGVGGARWQKPVSDLVKPSGWSPMESRQLRRRPETRRVLKGLKPLVLGGKSGTWLPDGRLYP